MEIVSVHRIYVLGFEKKSIFYAALVLEYVKRINED